VTSALASWGLIAAAIGAGWFGYGWRGVVLAITVIAFWLLLQFSRALRAMNKAAGAPVGRVASAVLLHSRLRQGMTLAGVLALTRSLGERIEPAGPGADEGWRWRDAGDVVVAVHLHGGKVASWTLSRPGDATSA
jgi:hypothetical protein